jgi:hypothetical protein
MNTKRVLWVALLALSISWGFASTASAQDGFTTDFFIEECNFSITGTNTFFILNVGFQLILEGEDDGEDIHVEITVLPDTEMVNNVQTRVVEEREWIDDELAEVSRNFFARCKETNSVFYFGEDVDIYEDGEIVGHEGEWRAGVAGAEPGIIMPGTILVGSRYFNEIAPGVALDQVEHIAVDVDVVTEAGEFERCLEVLETTPLEPGAEDTKVHCPGVGLVIDGPLELISIIEHKPLGGWSMGGF